MTACTETWLHRIQYFPNVLMNTAARLMYLVSVPKVNQSIINLVFYETINIVEKLSRKCSFYFSVSLPYKKGRIRNSYTTSFKENSAPGLTNPCKYYKSSFPNFCINTNKTTVPSEYDWCFGSHRYSGYYGGNPRHRVTSAIPRPRSINVGHGSRDVCNAYRSTDTS